MLFCVLPLKILKSVWCFQTDFSFKRILRRRNRGAIVENIVRTRKDPGFFLIHFSFSFFIVTNFAADDLYNIKWKAENSRKENSCGRTAGENGAFVCHRIIK